MMILESMHNTECLAATWKPKRSFKIKTMKKQGID